MALNCKIVKGVADSCTPNVSGINRMVIANWSEDYTFTASQGSEFCIDTIDFGQEKAFNFAIADGTGTASIAGTVGGNNSSRYFMHSVGGTIQHLDCDLLGDFANFFLGKVIIFVETKNRDVYAFGVDNGLTASTWEYQSGVADGDANGVNFVFEGAQPNPALKIKDWATVKALIA